MTLSTNVGCIFMLTVTARRRAGWDPKPPTYTHNLVLAKCFSSLSKPDRDTPRQCRRSALVVMIPLTLLSCQETVISTGNLPDSMGAYYPYSGAVSPDKNVW
jgi:hypothetical protein